jgi:hypothetical protein
MDHAGQRRVFKNHIRSSLLIFIFLSPVYSVQDIAGLSGIFSYAIFDKYSKKMALTKVRAK